MRRSVHWRFPKAESVVNIDMRQIAFESLEVAVCVGRLLLLSVVVERPTLRAALARGLRIARRPAFAAIEGRELAAHPPVLPHQAIAGRFDATGSEGLLRRRLEDLGFARDRCVRPFLESHEFPVAPADTGTPQAAVFRVHGYRIPAKLDPVVTGGIDGGIRIRPPLRNPAVSVRVEHCGAP